MVVSFTYVSVYICIYVYPDNTYFIAKCTEAYVVHAALALAECAEVIDLADRRILQLKAGLVVSLYVFLVCSCNRFSVGVFLLSGS